MHPNDLIQRNMLDHIERLKWQLAAVQEMLKTFAVPDEVCRECKGVKDHRPKCKVGEVLRYGR